MYIRISTARFPNQTKADAWIALYKNTLLEKLEKNTRIKNLKIFSSGEGKVTGIATYNSFDEYKLTEKTIKAEVNALLKSLDGNIEWQEGKVIVNWKRL